MATCSLISAVYTLWHGAISQTHALLSVTEKKIDQMAHQQLKNASQPVESASLKNHFLKEIILEQDFLVDIHSSGTIERKIQKGKEVIYFRDHTLERPKNFHSFHTEGAFFNYLKGRCDVDTWEIKDQSLAKTIYLHREPAGEGIEKCTSLAELYRLLSKETNGKWEIQRADARSAPSFYVLDQSSIFQLRFKTFNSKEALLEACKLYNKQQAICSKLWKAFSLVAAVTSTMKIFHLWTDSMQGGIVSHPLGLTSLTISYQAIGVTLKVATLAHLFSCVPSALSQTTGMMSQSVTYLKAFGGSSEDVAHAAYPTSDGGTLVAGYTTNFGSGGADVLISKLASNGTLLWSQVFGGGSDDVAFAAYPTSDKGTLVAGYTRSFGFGNNDILVSKLASNGTLLWTQVFGGIYDDAARAAYRTSDGGILVAGYTGSFGAGGNDVLVSKLASNGTLLWTHVFGGGSNDVAFAAYPMSDGGILVAGETGSFGVGGADVLVSKLDSMGTLLWTQVFGGGSDDLALAAYPTSDGGILVAGYTNSFGAGGADVLVSKLASNGTLLWTHVFGGGSTDVARAAYPTSDGGILVAGDTNSFGAGGDDVLVSKLASNGTLLWSQVFRGSSDDVAYAAYPTNDGGTLLAGYTYSFGAGGPAVLVSKLDSNGNILNCPALHTVFPNQTTWSISSSLVSPTSQSWTPTVVSPSFNSSFVNPTQTSVCYSSPSLTTAAPGTTLAFAQASTNSITTETIARTTSRGSSLAPATQSGLTSLPLTSSTAATIGTTGFSASTSSGAPLANLTSSPHLVKSSTPSSSSLPILIGSVAGGVALVALGALGIGLGLRRKRQKSQSTGEAQVEMHSSSAETPVYKAFQHSLPESLYHEGSLIGRKYLLVQKIHRTEAQDLYSQTGFEAFLFPNQEEAEIKIGNGNYGRVDIARNLETGQYVAVKKVEGEKNIQESKQEAKLLAKLKGKPHIISYLDSVEFKDLSLLYQFMPLASFGDGTFLQWKLCSVLDPLLKEKLLVYVAQGLLSGMREMHQAQIYHLDLKPANFVMDKKGSPYLIDFGCAYQAKEREGVIESSQGDRKYFSPERMLYNREKRPYKGDKADSWSLGLTLLELALDKHPLLPAAVHFPQMTKWESADFQQQLSQIKEIQQPPKDSFFALVKGLLDIDPHTRLTAAQALQMPLFQRKEISLSSYSDQQLQELFKEVKNLPSPKADPSHYVPKSDNPDYFG